MSYRITLSGPHLPISRRLVWYYGWVKMSPENRVLRAENDVSNCTERLRMCLVPVAVCICVRVCVCHGWLGTCGLMCSVLLQFNRFCINSLLSLCQSITSIHSVMLLFLFIHFFFCTRSQFYLFLSFLWNCPSTVILLCHPLSYSFI